MSQDYRMTKAAMSIAGSSISRAIQNDIDDRKAGIVRKPKGINSWSGVPLHEESACRRQAGALHQQPME